MKDEHIRVDGLHHWHLKQFAAQQGVSMKQVVEVATKEFMRKNGYDFELKLKPKKK